MNKFKYLKISNTKKIRYLSNYYKKNLYIVFLHGFMSDIEGKKPKSLLRYANKNKIGFPRSPKNILDIRLSIWDFQIINILFLSRII